MSVSVKIKTSLKKVGRHSKVTRTCNKNFVKLLNGVDKDFPFKTKKFFRSKDRKELFTMSDHCDPYVRVYVDLSSRGKFSPSVGPNKVSDNKRTEMSLTYE